MPTRREIDVTRFMYDPPGHYDVRDLFIDYSKERLIAKGKDCLRAWTGFLFFMDVVPPQQDVTKLHMGQIEDFVDYRMRSTPAKSLLTPQRDLTFVKAALYNAHRRNRIEVIPYFEVPNEEGVTRRPLTDPEFRLVIKQWMSERLRRFYWMAYYTGHRSQAIEQLEWSRVDFETGLMDFNVSGRVANNKKRCSAFPIPDDLLPRLLSWRARAKDNYVIGLGPTGLVSTTYHEASYVVRKLCGLTDPTLVPRHCMRHMFATELADRMIAATGHADMHTIGFLMADAAKTVEGRYFKVKKSRLADAANLRTRELIMVPADAGN